MAIGGSGCWECCRDHRTLGALHHEGALSWGGRGVEDLDRDREGSRLEEDLVLHLPSAVRPGHHVAEAVAGAVGYQDYVVLGHRLRVSKRYFDVEDAADRRYGRDTALGTREHDRPDLGLARTDWQRQPADLTCRYRRGA